MLQKNLTKAILTLVLYTMSLCFSAACNALDLRLTKPELVGFSSSRLQNIDSSMQRLINQQKISGAVSLLARKGKVVHFKAQGLDDIAAKKAMRTDSIFRLYSQTKPITGVAVMMLFEEGQFLLSDPIAKYLPEFKNMRVYVGEKNGKIQTEPARPITIHQLLTHTSGLSYDFIASPVAEMYKQAGVFGADSQSKLGSLDEWTKALAKQPLINQPGEKWNYSVGMDVLGRLVEVVSGQSFRSFLKERILEPLDMVDTDFYVPSDKLNRLTVLHMPAEEGGLKPVDMPTSSPFSKLPEIEMGGSGLVGTVQDYYKFAQMLADRGEYKGKHLLGRKTVEFMMSNHMTPNLTDDPLTSLSGGANGYKRVWGIGFGLTGSVVTNPATSGLAVSKGTFGWGGAATTMFWVDVEEEIVGIVHTQLFPSGSQPVGRLMQLTSYQALIN